jgi:hypothetical protein
MEDDMYKVLRFLNRLPAVSPDQFTSCWRKNYADAVVKAASGFSGLLKYAQDVCIPADSPIENAPPVAIDGIDEFWFKDAGAAELFFLSDTYLKTILPVENTFIDRQISTITCGSLHVKWHRQANRKENPVKVIIQVAKKASLTQEEFRHHWLEVHTALALNGPTTRKHIQRGEYCPGDMLPLGGFNPNSCDGVGAVSFDSIDDLQAEFSADYYRDTLAVDEKRFTNPDLSRVSLVNEQVLLVSGWTD